MAVIRDFSSTVRRFLSRGEWFDLGIFLANIWLVPFLTRLSEEGDEKNLTYALILLISIVLYSLGAGLKRVPLQARLAHRPPNPAPTWALIALFVLMIMQFALYMLSGFLALGAFSHRFSSHPLMPGLESPVMLPLTLLLATIPVIMTIRALIKPRLEADPEKLPLLRRREKSADIALYLSAIMSLSIWDGAIMGSLAGNGPYPWYASILLVTLITVPYAMFYASPRILFLVEDYRRPGTWLRLGMVMMPLTVRLLS